MKTELWVSRAVYAAQMRKECPGCGQPIERDDLIMEEDITTGKMKKEWGTDWRTRKRVYTGKEKPEVKHKVWHKSCWYASRGEEDWYRPGIMAEDPEEVNPRRTAMKGRYYQNPRVTAAERDRDHDINIQLSPAATAPAPAKSGGGIGWMIFLLLLAGAGFAGYWFLYRHTYSVGDNLQYIGDAGTYQIIELKYVGIVHTYVMQNSEGGSPVEYPVSEVDKDPNWQPI
jgi:hypothetical protein